MSKISKAVVAMGNESKLRKSETVTNFMGGDSYKVNPLMRLKLVTSSSIFGEPSYYRDSMPHAKDRYVGRLGSRVNDYDVAQLLANEDILGLRDPENKDKDAVTLMEEVIDESLDYDFEGTIKWAAELRNEFYIRLNPQVIMVRAALHPKRKEFTSKNPKMFNIINRQVMARADDSLSQLSYYLFKNGGNKSKIPSVIKRSWAAQLSSLTRYQVAKYKSHDIGMINAVRICHASSPVLNELMETGKVDVTEEKQTWENLRSEGKSWEYIFTHVNMGHMALLRNIRNFLSEVDNFALAKEYMDKLKSGVIGGKQFPFRYYSAYIALEKCYETLHNKQLALDTLEECIDISIENMPKLHGRTMCLSDNSGSAWGAFESEYGTVTVAEIDNLSSVITAMCSDEGYVGKFGDKLVVYPISKRKGALQQAREISYNRANNVGGSTEGGIWEFFHKAINTKEHWDNIFIYSDQQAGTGGLYGTPRQMDECDQFGYLCGRDMINVFKLVIDYRRLVFNKVNVFSVQTAGYDNVVVPDYAYRTNLMYGWTGKELIFADAVIRQWNQLDS